MATVTSEPANIVPVLNEVVYELTMASGGTSPIELSLGYQLLDGGNNPLTEEEETPYLANGFRYDFRNDIDVYTPPPAPGVQAINSVPEMQKQFKLRHWEWQFDGSDGSKVKVNETTTATRNAINGGFQLLSLSPYSGSYEVLSLRPAMNYTCHTTEDWLYIYANNPNFTIRAVGTYPDGSRTTVVDQALNGSVVNQIPIGPANGFWNGTWNTIGLANFKISLRNGGALVEEWTFVFDCCDFPRQIAWLEPAGGFAGMEFDRVSGQSVNRTSELICFDNFAAVGYDHKKGWITGNSTNQRQITLTKQLQYTEGHESFFEGLVSSNNIYILQSGKGGSFYVRFNLQGGAPSFHISGDNVIISLTGIIGNQVLTKDYE